MKSQEKVKRQRRIKSIAPYCDNPSPIIGFSGTTSIRYPLNKKVGKHRNSKFAGKKIAHRRTLRRINRTNN